MWIKEFFHNRKIKKTIKEAMPKHPEDYNSEIDYNNFNHSPRELRPKKFFAKFHSNKHHESSPAKDKLQLEQGKKATEEYNIISDLFYPF